MRHPIEEPESLQLRPNLPRGPYWLATYSDYQLLPDPGRGFLQIICLDSLASPPRTTR